MKYIFGTLLYVSVILFTVFINYLIYGTFTRETFIINMLIIGTYFGIKESSEVFDGIFKKKEKKDD